MTSDGPAGTLRRGGVIVGTTISLACLVVLVGDGAIRHGPLLLQGLDADDRTELYKLLAPIEATLAGFLIAAVAILTALDRKREIVAELSRGESLGLLTLTLLAAALDLILATAAAGIAAIVDDGAKASSAVAVVNEIILVVSFELSVVGGALFGLVTYKVARYD